MNTAYVRLGNRSHIAEVVPLEGEFPEEFFAFGQRVGDYLVVSAKRTSEAQIGIACDWLRDRDWHVEPECNVTPQSDIGYWTATSLKARGWTQKMVEQHLGEPDKEIDNPKYKVASPMRLYARCRVRLIEAKSVIAEQLRQNLDRRSSRRGAAPPAD